MRALFLFVVRLVCIAFSLSMPCCGVRYEPNWASLDTRPLPGWYDDAKFGIFMHWGVFSVPSYADLKTCATGGVAWFWWFWQGTHSNGYIKFMNDTYAPGFTYADFAPNFKAEFYNPDEWAELFQAAGARYAVLTSKHHEGYCNWPSKASWNWNSMDVGPRRDLVGELAQAIRNKTDIHFGLYHSMYEFFNSLYLADKASGFKTNDFVTRKTLPELYDIVNTYKPELIWSDGDWEAPYTYWNSTGFLAWLYNDSPVKDIVAVNDRWGKGITCHHGGYYTCTDRFNPSTLQKHKYENAMTLERYAWGYRRNAVAADYIPAEELIHVLIQTVSTNGNMLMNVGPTPDGRIPPIVEERLRDMGKWLAVNGEAIYKTKPWLHQNDSFTPNIWYTASKVNDSVYAIVLKWPHGDTLYLDAPVTTSGTNVTMLGYPGEFKWTPEFPSGINIKIPPISVHEIPCDFAWVFVLRGVQG